MPTDRDRSGEPDQNTKSKPDDPKPATKAEHILRKGEKCPVCGQVITQSTVVEPLVRVRILGDGKGKDVDGERQADAGQRVMILGVLHERGDVCDLPQSEAANAIATNMAEEVDGDTPLGKPDPEDRARRNRAGGLGNLRNASRTLGADPKGSPK